MNEQTAIIIITYNIDIRVFLLQIMAIKKFCKDDHQIIVVDNSTNEECIDGIAYQCNIDSGIIYHKTMASSRNGSESHAFAANFIMNMIKDEYAFYFFLDHDCIPVKPFSVKEILKDKTCAGIGQTKSKLYFWAGCFMYDSAKALIPFSLSPSREMKLDTGGETYKLIDEYGKDECVFFDEKHVQNPDFDKSMYNFYSMIFNETFMHFINASNWNRSNSNEERLNSLLNITQKKIDEFSSEINNN